MNAQPIPMKWDGESFSPASQHWARIADKQFVVGEVYRMVEEHERSGVSHRHYFAAINEAWQNLREDQVEQFATPDILRKFALIRTGYANQRQFVASSKAQARDLAAFIRSPEEYAVVTVQGPVVTVWTAQSQSMRAMGKAVFQVSKQAVLDYVSTLIGVTPEALSSNAARAA